METARLLLCQGAYPLIPNKGLRFEKNAIHATTLELFKIISEAKVSDQSLDTKKSLERCLKILGNGINIRDSASLDTPLHIAIRRKNRDHMLQLLATDPITNIANKAGETAYSLGKAYLEEDSDPLLLAVLDCSRAASLFEEIAKGFEIIERWKDSEFVVERLEAEAKLRVEMNKFARELCNLLPECMVVLQQLTAKIAKLEAEAVPSDTKAIEELANCKKVPAKVALRLGTLLAMPESEPRAPWHAYRILKQVDKSDPEAFVQANRIMYKLVLQFPELGVYLASLNFDQTKEVQSLFATEISNIPARLQLEIATPASKKESETDDKMPSAIAEISSESQALSLDEEETFDTDS